MNPTYKLHTETRICENCRKQHEIKVNLNGIGSCELCRGRYCFKCCVIFRDKED